MAEAADRKLVVSVEGRVNRLEKALERARKKTKDEMGQIARAIETPQKRMDDLGRRADVMSRKLKGAFGGIGGIGKNLISATALGSILSLTGALAKARQAVKDFDDIADQASASGLNTDFFQALKAGAIEAGASQEQLNSALVTFAKNSGLAAEGKGRMTTALKALNPELLASIQHATTQEQRLRLLAEALGRETDASKRAALGAAALGDNWAELLPIFAKGAAGIDDLVQRAGALGLIVPAELLARAGELEGKLNTLSAVIDTQLNAALVELGPLLTMIATAFATLAKDIRNIPTDPVIQFFAAVATEMERGSSLGQALSASWANLGQSTKALSKESAGAAQTIPQLVAEVEKIEASIVDLKAIYGDGFMSDAATAADVQRLRIVAGELDALLSKGHAVNVQLHRRAEDTSMAALSTLQAPPATPRSGSGAGGSGGRSAAISEAERQKKAVTDLIEELQFENSLVGASVEQQRVMTELRRAGAAATNEQAAEIVGLVQRNIELEAAQDRAREAQEQLNQAMERLGSTAGDALGRIIVDGANATDVMRELLAEMAKALIKSSTMNIFKILGSGLSSGLSSEALSGISGAGLFHQGGIAGEPGPMRLVPGSLFRHAPRFHTGRLPGELPAIIKQGEAVLSEGMTSEMGNTIRGLSRAAEAARAAPAQQADININVSGARGNQEIMEMVSAGVGQGLKQYDKTLPYKIRDARGRLRS